MRKKEATQTDPPTSEDRALVPRRPWSSIVPSNDGTGPNVTTDLDLSSYEGRAMAVNAKAAADLDLGDSGSIDLRICHYVVTRELMVNEQTGELEERPRTVLYTTDGDTFSTTSVVIPHRIKDLITSFSKEEWASGLHVQIYNHRKKRGVGSYHELRVLPS